MWTVSVFQEFSDASKERIRGKKLFRCCCWRQLSPSCPWRCPTAGGQRAWRKDEGFCQPRNHSGHKIQFVRVHQLIKETSLALNAGLNKVSLSFTRLLIYSGAASLPGCGTPPTWVRRVVLTGCLSPSVFTSAMKIDLNMSQSRESSLYSWFKKLFVARQ